MVLQSTNPADEKIFATVQQFTDEQVEAALATASTAFADWRQLSIEQRAVPLRRLADLLRQRKIELSTMMTNEMGKVITQGFSEIEKCAWTCEYVADTAAEFLAAKPIASDATESYVQFDPLGIILAVMPWNFPFWQVIRFAAPALMAGNVGILKHASNVQQCAAAIEKLFIDAGFPVGVFQNLLIESGRVEKIIKDPRVVAVTLTGSEAAGAAVAKTAAAEIKKAVLELGGSDPFIVLDDADVAAAAIVGAQARLLSNGQSCIAAKRFIVTKAVADKFIAAFKTEFEKMVVGDPLDEKTNVGPMVNSQGLATLEQQVNESVQKGARLITGGKRLDQVGFFYPPTIVADVKKGMPLYDQEVFGPAAAVITVVNEDEAITVANDTIYGLGASLWTNDVARAQRLATKINAGMIFINGLVKSDPRLPFGGIKRSGFGRELSLFGIREFVNIKTVWRK